MSKPLASCVAKQAQVAGQKPCQVIGRNRQHVLKQPRISGGKTSYCSALPYQDATVAHSLRANEKIGAVRQKTRSAKYFSGHQPKQVHFPPLWRDKEITSSAFDQQKKLICRLSLICHHGVTGESPIQCRLQDGVSVRLR